MFQKELDMVKISKDASKVPSWLKCTKTMIPDFVAKDPKVTFKFNLYNLSLSVVKCYFIIYKMDTWASIPSRSTDKYTSPLKKTGP